MTRNILMVGISALAFAASAASAQTNGVYTDNGAYPASGGTDANGNRVVVSCTNGNDCQVDQGTTGSTFNSVGAVGSSGTFNLERVEQRGNQLNGQVSSSGDRNSGQIAQRGFANSALISQTGTVATIGTAAPGANGAASANSATVTQGDGANNANNNSATIVQVRTPSSSTSTENGNVSAITQANVTGTTGSTGNAATSTQNGTNLTSIINQRDANGTQIATSNNRATVVQVGLRGNRTTGSSSTITQSERGNVANVSLYDGGVATSPTNSARNDSNVTQSNRFVSATDTGFTTTTGGSGFAVGTANGAGAGTTANSPVTGNSVDVAVIGRQNNSVVTQNGVLNTVSQSITNGGSGNTSAANNSSTNTITQVGNVPTGRIQGNSSTINQTGLGNAAVTSIGGSSSFVGQGNQSQITQAQGSAAVTQASFSNSSATLNASQAHRASVFQRGTLDSSNINQSNNGVGGTGSDVQSGSFADVSQLSFNSTVSVTQVGTNYAIATQGSAGSASDQLTINQIDAGDRLSGGSNGSSGTFGGTASGSGATASQSSNTVLASQAGIQNTATVGQNGINASASVFQNRSTRGSQLNVEQGTQSAAPAAGFATNNQITAGFSAFQITAQQAGGTSAYNLNADAQQLGGQTGTGSVANNQNSTAGNAAAQAVVNNQNAGLFIVQGGHDLSATATQQGGTATASGTAIDTVNNSNNSILIGQAFQFNSATVNQNGLGQVATVEQRGSGAAGQLNLVTITQNSSSGTTTSNGNRAVARQTTNVGASATGNTTVATDPSGTMSRSGVNSAEIRIAQTGFSNSATVEQRGKGQYASITQNNATSTSVNGNTGTILQDVGATNAVAILSQTGAGNTYTIFQDTAGQFARVVQDGTGNNVISASGAANGGAAGTLPVGAGALGTVN